MIRAAEPRDYDAFVALSRELGTDDPTPPRERWEKELAPGTIVYERDGAVIGYASFRMLAAAGHVSNLAVAPAARRGGIGRALMLAAAARLRAAELRDWQLNVKEDNTAAIALYESLGFARAYGSAFVRLAWADVARLPAAGGGVAATIAAPEDDAELERALGLVAGRLASARRAGTVCVQLRATADAAPVGVARFDPAHPGAYPFRVARPELAGTLLAALRPHARPGDAWLGVAVEDDPALVAALVAAGAEVRMRVVHYRGALPAA